jgi:hypothetical protein
MKNNRESDKDSATAELEVEDEAGGCEERFIYGCVER